MAYSLVGLFSAVHIVRSSTGDNFEKGKSGEFDGGDRTIRKKGVRCLAYGKLILFVQSL